MRRRPARHAAALLVGLALLATALAGCTTSVSQPDADGRPAEPGPAGSDAPSPSASAGADEPAFVTGLTIPWAVGGERIRRDGTKGNDPGEWPPFPVQATRLWDARTTWLHLEPADDQWEWTTLDAHLAKAEQEGVDDVTLVLASTPRWAAVRTTKDDAPWLGPGSASPPRDIKQWREYVRTVAQRYAGRIDAYEIGNEPNLATFWNGTPEQYAELVAVAAEEIRRADPDATIAVNAGLVRRANDLPALATWLGPALQQVGSAVAGSAGADVDVVTVHVYPSVAQVDGVIDLLVATRQELTRIAALPAWVTEMNVRDGSALPPAEQRRVVADLPRAVEAAGFDRAYWYAWTDLGPESLIQFAPGTPGAKVLRAASRPEQG
jgi:hypothetical protein